jgi:hypothetical protein
LVDGRNCRLPDADAWRIFEPTVHAYREAGDALMLSAEPASDLAAWLLHRLADPAPGKERP